MHKPAFILLSLLSTVPLAAGLRPPRKPHTRPAVISATPGAQPVIQIALLLDTSGSMDGLIDQAKSQLWRLVNQFAPATRRGRRPQLQVALYEYGKSSISSRENYLRMLLPFTTDLDRVSEELFALTTNGGDEYCGAVIQAALHGLQWSVNPDDLKVIFIAGNEPFTQGAVDYRAAVGAATRAGVTVNTIFCGDTAEGIATNWRDGALLGGGSYMSIDQNRKTPQITAPQDAAISELNRKLNETYVAFGRRGDEGKARQEAQDSNASSMGAMAAAPRAAAKASELYDNSGWDLVDADKKGAVKLDALQKDDLPAEMRTLDAPQRRAYLDAKAKERADIQARIRALDSERQKFVEAELKKQSAAQPAALDDAMLKALQEQAKKNGFEFNAPAPAPTPVPAPPVQ